MEAARVGIASPSMKLATLLSHAMLSDVCLCVCVSHMNAHTY
jgi:hypothetical protein